MEAAAAAMDTSAAATGSADADTPAAPAEGAEGDDADTEESSSDSELPTERSVADVDMGEEMTEACGCKSGPHGR